MVTGHGCESNPSHIAATAMKNEEKRLATTTTMRTGEILANVRNKVRISGVQDELPKVKARKRGIQRARTDSEDCKPPAIPTCLEENLLEVHEKLAKIETDVWGKLIVMEKNRRMAKAYLRNTIIRIDGSYKLFDGFRIGLAKFHAGKSFNSDTGKFFRDLEEGICLRVDKSGNLWMKKYTDRQEMIVNTYSSTGNVHRLCLEHNRFKNIINLQALKETLLMEISSGRPREELHKYAVIFIEISSYLTSSAADNSLECHLWMALIHLVIIEMIDMLLMANNTFSQQSETEIYTELSLQQDSSDYQPMTSPSTNRSSVLSSPCSEYNHSLAFSTDSTSTPKTYLKMNGATARRILRRNPTVSLKTDRTDMILIPCYASKFHSHSDGLITQPEKNDDYENIPLKSEENYFPQPKKRLCEYIPESAQASKGWSMVDLTDLGTTSGLVYFQNSSEPSKSKPKHFLIKENKSNHNYLDRNMPFIALEDYEPFGDFVIPVNYCNFQRRLNKSYQNKIQKSKWKSEANLRLIG